MRRHLQIPLPSSEAVDEMLLFSPSEIYHENSKIHPTDFGSFAWIHLVGSSDEIKQIITHPFTHYHGYPQISLPRIFRPTKQSFEDILIKRRSVRAFSGEPISLESLAKILFLSGGITGESHEPSGVVWHLRAAPSGGGLYPVDLYVAALRIEELSEGLYFYAPLSHSLEQLSTENLEKKLSEMTNLHAVMQKAGAVIILCARFMRSKFKYGERAYRFVLLEAGHIAQNLLLTAQAEGLGGLAVGGFADDALNEVLQVDGVREAAIYMIAIGYPSNK